MLNNVILERLALFVNSLGVKKTEQIGFRVSPELKAALAALAEAERRTLSDYIQIVLEKHVQDAQLEASE